jgi:hemin uptake protein HemP
MDKTGSPSSPTSRRETERQVHDAASARPLASTELLQGARYVEISHNGLLYRLQATRLGKLILTK